MQHRQAPLRDGSIIEEKNPHTGEVLNRYSKGRLLGKGGFAKCYQFTNLATGTKHAAKVIEKSSLTRSKAKEKLTSEIKIHKSARSIFVVKYERYFEDSEHVYIVLELCTNQTLNELVKRRKRITDIEAKYYLHQLTMGLKDLHAQGIIHRDLKLGNLLLTDKLEIRIGDFGLAAKVNSPSERRKTMCGTPNYIAPEILQNTQGHSFEVDIWSMGIIAYAFLIGRPPFETNDIKTTYTRIKACNYSYPDDVPISTTAKSFISKLLQRQPSHRATLDEILADPFLTQTAIPACLPASTLACPPNSNFIKQFAVDSTNKLTLSTAIGSEGPSLSRNQSRKDLLTDRTDRLCEPSINRPMTRTNSIEQVPRNAPIQRAASIAVLMRGVKAVSKLGSVVPRSTLRHGPQVWVSYFEDYKKFGLAYLLNSNAVGMRFNDATAIILNVELTRFMYLANYKNPETAQVHQMNSVPETLAKKYKIITHYKSELRRNKDTAEAHMTNQQLIDRERLRFRESRDTQLQTFVIKYVRTNRLVIFWFNNKDYQAIFKDGSELLVGTEYIAYSNKVGERKYFEKELLEFQSDDVKQRMSYVIKFLQNMTSFREKATGAQNPSEYRESENTTEAPKKDQGTSGSSSILPPPTASIVSGYCFGHSSRTSNTNNNANSYGGSMKSSGSMAILPSTVHLPSGQVSSMPNMNYPYYGPISSTSLSNKENIRPEQTLLRSASTQRVQKLKSYSINQNTCTQPALRVSASTSRLVPQRSENRLNY